MLIGEVSPAYGTVRRFRRFIKTGVEFTVVFLFFVFLEGGGVIKYIGKLMVSDVMI